MDRKSTGELGEKLAAEYLVRHGYAIIETNYRTRGGEIDIVAKQGGCLVFVEVRAKRNTNFGTPEESITQTKMSKLRATAEQYYQARENLPEAYRIDVIAIEFGRGALPARIEHYENAVGAE